jgi:2,4-dienoyl-CoA reductase-like NADH-dependent reductase (Old Yellow Enzyme family)
MNRRLRTGHGIDKVLEEDTMGRSDYEIFSEGKIGTLTLSNRLVRSGTWDPSILSRRQMTDEVLDLYRGLALGGAGMIITGDFPIMTAGMASGEDAGETSYSYEDIRIAGLDQLVDVVHSASPGCKIIAQLSRGHMGPAPSDVPSPFLEEGIRPLRVDEIHTIIDCFAETIFWMREEGFDGVQIHAAHGGLLSCFLSPYTNRRDDEYGGSVRNRARIVREILSGAREKVGDFPILIKMNGTDYLEGGIDVDSFPDLAQEVASAGVDAIEVSGGMWDCLVRSEEELGFRPVPAPESHTRITSPDEQSYFLKYARRLDLDVPVILVGGNRDIERLEEIVRQGKVDFISMCRPLVCEPDLPRHWLEGRGGSAAECISCNSCLYDMHVHPGRDEPGVVTCVFKKDKQQHREAQQWLASWVEKNVVT